MGKYSLQTDKKKCFFSPPIIILAVYQPEWIIEKKISNVIIS